MDPIVRAAWRGGAKARLLAVPVVLGMLLAGSAGLAGPVSAAEPGPAQPAAPTVSGGNSRIAVQWSAIDGATGYRVELRTASGSEYSIPLSGTCAAVVPAPDLGCTVEGLSNGTAYVVRLIATGDPDSAPSADSVQVTPAAVPSGLPAPTVIADYRAVRVQWGVPADDGGAAITAYSVWISAGDEAHFVRATACSGTLLARTCRITGLAGGQRYFLRVRASNRVGPSDRGPSGTAVALRPGDVTLAFGGDVHFSGAAAAQAGSGGLSSLPTIFAGADVSMVNLETALASSSAVPVAKEYTFRASPRVLGTLDRAGVDVVTMANNHGVDYGRAGLATTLAARATSPVPIVGVGRTTADAIKPWVTTVRGTRIAFFGFVGLDLAQEENTSVARSWPATVDGPGLAVWRNHSSALLSAVRSWSAKVDVVVVYVHWGREMATCPNGAQQAVAAKLSTAGASVIVGAHPHVLQGAGWVGKSLVAYSLGNFAWYAYSGRPSAALIVKIHNLRPVSYAWRPTTYTSTGRPVLVSGSEARATRALLAERSAAGCSGLAVSRSGLGWLGQVREPVCAPPLAASEQQMDGFE